MALGCKVPPNPKWIEEGWTQRFVADERMLKDATITYEELGYEIRTESFSPQQVPEVCQGCQLSLLRFRVLYTRKKN